MNHRDGGHSMQYEFNLACAAQYEFDLSAKPGEAASDEANALLTPAEPTRVTPAPAACRAG
jgi:hypothetical protein